MDKIEGEQPNCHFTRDAGDAATFKVRHTMDRTHIRWLEERLEKTQKEERKKGKEKDYLAFKDFPLFNDQVAFHKLVVFIGCSLQLQLFPVFLL
jgi:hypothetical protein